MKITMLISVISISLFSAKAQTAEISISSFEEMDRLISAENSTREYLWCAVASTKINMMDMHDLFIRKVARETDDQTSLLMAYTYMMGFYESEMLNIEPEVNEGELLGMLYSSHCMKHILPNREGE